MKSPCRGCHNEDGDKNYCIDGCEKIGALQDALAKGVWRETIEVERVPAGPKETGMATGKCGDCNKEGKLLARGFCPTCYDRFRRESKKSGHWKSLGVGRPRPGERPESKVAIRIDGKPLTREQDPKLFDAVVADVEPELMRSAPKQNGGGQIVSAPVEQKEEPVQNEFILALDFSDDISLFGKLNNLADSERRHPIDQVLYLLDKYFEAVE